MNITSLGTAKIRQTSKKDTKKEKKYYNSRQRYVQRDAKINYGGINNGGCGATLDSNAFSVAGTDNQQIRGVLRDMRREAGRILGGRQKTCGVVPLFQNNRINIILKDEKLHYSGLETCGSVWACPVCAYKITERRVIEIKEVVQKMISGGACVSMMTLTFPHNISMSCRKSKRAIANAWRKVKGNRRQFQRLKDSIKYIGDIRSLEVTVGGNGWHPHLHITISGWCDHKALQEFAEGVFVLWRKEIRKMGYGTCSKDAFKIEPVYDVDGVAEYMTKWSIGSEMAKGHIKSSKGRTPFSILKDIVTGKSKDVEKDRKLYKEYGEAFFGARHLTWSKGLKDEYLDIKELTDEEIVKEKQAGEVVCSFNKKVWWGIVKKEKEGEILCAYENRGLNGVSALLKNLGIKHEKKDNVFTYIGSSP